MPLPAAAAGILADLLIVRPLEFAVRLRRAAHLLAIKRRTVTPPGRAVIVSIRPRPARVVLVRRAALRSIDLRITIKRRATSNPFGAPGRPDSAGLRAAMPNAAALWDDFVANLGTPARIRLTEGDRTIEWKAAHA